MRTIVIAASLSLALSAAILSACGQPNEPAPPAPTVPAAEQTAPAAPAARQRASVEGWDTDLTSFPLIGSTLPAFALSQSEGTQLTQENLRGRWTIIGFAAPTDDALKSENDYVAALNSAADQDPDLDFLAIREPSDAAPATPPTWPTLNDDAGYTDNLGVTTTPAYLLVGPDLTIEGYRGALSATPDDGIKSVIRGVAEVRKQIAAPQ